GRYGSKVKLFDKKPPESFKLNIEGKGARGFFLFYVAIRLEEQGPDTILHYAAKNQIGGPIAAIGQRLVVPAAKMMINQGFKSLEKQLAERKR
ncbi:carbon monoxide dehydrogenase, partial [Candidatus Parcubacteria bacterium]